MMHTDDIFTRTKDASRSLQALDASACNAILLRVADAIVEESGTLLEANARDLAAM